MLSTDIERQVILLAADESGADEKTITRESRLDHIFSDSLDYLQFTLELGKLGKVSDETIAHAGTIGDLIDALTPAN